MNCVRCGKPATFEAPAKMCSEHWCQWWGAMDPTGRMYRDAKRGEFVDRLPLSDRFIVSFLVHPIVDCTFTLMEGVARVLRWKL